MLHPSYPYIVFNDLPKVDNLKRLFAADYRETPVTVMAASKAGRIAARIWLSILAQCGKHCPRASKPDGGEPPGAADRRS